MAKPRILILTVPHGAAHTRVANSLKNALLAFNPELTVEVENGLAHCARWFRTYYNSYEIPLKLWPSLWGWIENFQHHSTSTGPGWLYRQGGNLEARVQPRIEGALIVCMVAAILVSVVAGRVWNALEAALLVASGVLAAVRLIRWRLWVLRGRPDLLSIAAGYAWLAAGLVLFGAWRAGGAGLFGALHLITVGALGTLTLNVMAMTRMLKARRAPARSRVPSAGTALIALATVARALAGTGTQSAVPLLALAALAWSAAFALLLALIARTPARPPRTHE